MQPPVRLHRARQKIDSLLRTTGRFTVGFCVIKGAVPGDRHHYHWMRPTEPIPVDWSLDAGDILEDLRASLDHAVVATAPPSLAENERRLLAFPIAKDSVVQARWAKSLRPLSQDVQDAIWAAQPFRSTDPATHPLVVLDELVRAHKHREPLVALLVTTGISFNPMRFTGTYTVSARVPPEGLQFAVVHHHGPNADPAPVSPNHHLVLDHPIASQRELGDALRWLADSVEATIRTL
jgi:hypothetical protein